MQRVPGTGGRRKNVASGGGNAHRRGDGLGTGPVGGGSFGSSGSSDASGRSGGTQRGGTSLLPLLLGLLLGSGGGGKKGSGLKRILLIALLLFVGYMLLQRCSAQNALYGNDYTQTPALPVYSAEPQAPAATEPPASQSPSQQSETPDYSVSNKARPRYTTLKGGGQDDFTIMVYMCGADLESNYGMATSDLNEMLHATLSDNVKVIVETGGAKRWKNSIISNKTNQIYEVRDDGIKCLEKDIGRSAMTSADTLSDFIQYAVKTFPANRYGLILWDHGGGSLVGYGHDELYPGEAMALDQVDKALSDAGCKFDFLGFDACLMANYETAIVAERYADYLIASEETEPGSGWYYTDWLTALSRNPSMNTVELGKAIVDDFTAASQKQAAGSATTLSVIDLAQMAGTVPEAFNEFAKDTSALLDSDNYETISDARSDAREFARTTQINQIDLIDLCERIDTDASNDLAQALRDCVKYNRYSKGMSNSNGISIYFPYSRLSNVKQAIALYDDIEMDRTYTDCIRSFASLAAGGQIASGTSGSPLTTLLGGDSAYTDLLGGLLGASPSTGGGYGSGGYSTGSTSGSDILTSVLESYLSGGSSSSGSYSGSSGGYGDILTSLMGSGGALDWLDTGRMARSAAYYDANRLDLSRLVPTAKGSTKVLKLTDAEWDLVQNVQLSVFLDDGEGYIDLGRDNTYTWDDDSDLVMDYDRTWLSLNGQIVSYYFLSETRDDSAGTYVIKGYVPALLNGERVKIMLQFDDENPDGVVLGAQLVYDETTTLTQAKGLVEIAAGDQLDFLCDYYGYDGSYADSYMLGESMRATGSWKIRNVDIGGDACKVSYCLTDIYGNDYWTESLEY